MIRSLAHAKSAEVALVARLQKAQTAIQALTERKQGKEPFSAVERLQQAVEALLKQHKVEGLLQFQINEQVQEDPLRNY